jgi:hypothetical protein
MNGDPRAQGILSLAEYLVTAEPFGEHIGGGGYLLYYPNSPFGETPRIQMRPDPPGNGGVRKWDYYLVRREDGTFAPPRIEQIRGASVTGEFPTAIVKGKELLKRVWEEWGVQDTARRIRNLIS